MKNKWFRLGLGLVISSAIVIVGWFVITNRTKENAKDALKDKDVNTEITTTIEPTKESDVTNTKEDEVKVIEGNSKAEKVESLLNSLGVTDETIIQQVADMKELADFSEATSEQQEYPTLTLIGHASVKIKTLEGIVIYIDPYYDGDYSEPANYILVTHNHSDHTGLSKCTRADDCQIIKWSDAIVDKVYQTFEFDNLKIEAVPSGDNGNHGLYDNAGYIVTFDDVSVFHAGDTSMNEGKKDIVGKKIDYAMYPVDGTYNMGPEEATEVANMIGATHNIPIHGDAHNIFQQIIDFQPEGKLIVLYGQTIDLKPTE